DDSEQLLTNDETRAVLMRFSLGSMSLTELRMWASSKQEVRWESPYEAILGEVLMAVADDGFDVELAQTFVDRLGWELT
ncbi:hypothetical protein, partial [Schumannella sp. 10F1B-5-1]